MRLTEPQKQHLFELLIATDRPKPESAALEKLGLAIQGKGRYGEYVNITKEGVEVARKLDRPIEREARAIAKNLSMMGSSGARATAEVPPSKDGGRSLSPAGACVDMRAPATSSRSAATRRETRKSDGGTEHSSKPVSAESTTKSASSSRGLAPSSPKRAPNAVRVQSGNRFTYYPLSSFESLRHGSKTATRVLTSNKFYRSYPVEASGQDIAFP